MLITDKKVVGIIPPIILILIVGFYCLGWLDGRKMEQKRVESLQIRAMAGYKDVEINGFSYFYDDKEKVACYVPKVNPIKKKGE